MNDSKNSLTKFTNSVIPFLSIGIFIFYIVNNVKNNIYEILFIDEECLLMIFTISGLLKIFIIDLQISPTKH